MGEYKLAYPIHTLDDKELLPAGTVLTHEVMQELREAGREFSSVTAKLLGHRTIRKDLMTFFSQPPYDIIFSDPSETTAVLSVMEKVQLSMPILKSLDHFKDNDFYTYRHMLLVFAMTIRLSRDLVDPHGLMREAMASPSHDFGKICVPMDILKKTHPLSRTERNILEHHTLAGYVLLNYYADDPTQLAARIARDHHERANGSGYPIGLNANDYMVEIVVVSDIYDALISPRPYRPTSYDNRTALEEICDMAEKGILDPGIVKILVVANRRLKANPAASVISKDRRGDPPGDNVYGKMTGDNCPEASAG